MLEQLRTLRSTTVGACRRDLEKFPSPSWETHILLVVCRAAVFMSLPAQSQSQSRRPRSPGIQLTIMCTLIFRTPIAPMGDHVCSASARCLQGGGVMVYSGTVAISSCTISGNTAADYVRAHVQKFPMAPMGKLLTCLPQLTLSQLRTLWSLYRGFVPQKP